jgi:hypothetical protein
LERKLAAILCADVYGYSRLMGEDEEATLRTLTSHCKLIDSQIHLHHGRFVNSVIVTPWSLSSGSVAPSASRSTWWYLVKITRSPMRSSLSETA